MPDFFDFAVDGLDGRADLLGALRGKAVLAVNVASFCGYTSQYAGLQALHTELEEQHFTVVGFPCNQFGAQEPGTAQQIREFCTTNFGVSFPLAAKLDVTGAAQHPLFAWLTAPANGFPGEVEWNFEKFLISPDGRLVARYPSGTLPQDAGLLQDLAGLL